MEEAKLNEWIKRFEDEMKAVEIQYNAFFGEKKLHCFYSLKIDKQTNHLTLELQDEKELAREIVNRIIDAFSQTKPS